MTLEIAAAQEQTISLCAVSTSSRKPRQRSIRKQRGAPFPRPVPTPIRSCINLRNPIAQTLTAREISRAEVRSGVVLRVRGPGCGAGGGGRWFWGYALGWEGLGMAYCWWFESRSKLKLRLWVWFGDEWLSGELGRGIRRGTARRERVRAWWVGWLGHVGGTGAVA